MLVRNRKAAAIAADTHSRRQAGLALGGAKAVENEV
jgi:hypothetical protein